MTVAQKRTMLWGTIGLALLAGLAWAFVPRPVPADLTLVERGPLTVTIDEEGETRVRDVYTLSAPVAGRQRRIDLEAGDGVVASETIAAEIQPIDPELLDVRSEREARAAVQAAEAAQARAGAELQRAEADLEFARGELRRQQGLMDQGAVSERELDAAQREYRTSRAAVETARAALQQATFELDRTRARLVSPTEAREEGSDCCIPVRSPVTGRVLRVLHESAGVVQAGQPLIEIGDPEELEIVVDLLSADAVKVSQGDRVLIEEWGGDGALEGRVRRVEPYGFTKVSALGIEEQRVNVIIDFTDPREAWERLGHGYRVEVRIVVWEGEDVLKLPLSALFRQGEQWAVFTVEDGVARLRPVERGRHDGLEVQIRSGLEAGDRVVRYPSDQITDGVRVEQR